MSKQLSENTLNNEETLINELLVFFGDLNDEIIRTLEQDKIKIKDLPTFQIELKQIIADQYEEFKTIIGTNVINTFITASNLTEAKLVVKEKEIIIDTVINSDKLPETPVTQNMPITPTKVESNIDDTPYALKKKKLVKKITNTLDKWLNKEEVQEKLDKYIVEPVKTFTQSTTDKFKTILGETLRQGVRDSLETPELLFKIVPNEACLEFLENHVFTASAETMSRVEDNIMDIIKQGTEDGQHPYEVARELKTEFEDLTNVQARRIGRTEILRAENEAKWQRFQENETVEYVQWFNAMDDSSREDHAAQHEMITILGNPFPNGQRYPYDENSEPGDYINCRCDLEAFYPEAFLVPPPGADCWYEEEMVPQDTIPMGEEAGTYPI